MGNLLEYVDNKMVIEFAGVYRVLVNIQLPSRPLVESLPGVKLGIIIFGERGSVFLA